MNREELLSAIGLILSLTTYWIVSGTLAVIAIISIFDLTRTDEMDWGGATAVSAVFLMAWAVAGAYIATYWIDHESDDT